MSIYVFRLRKMGYEIEFYLVTIVIYFIYLQASGST